MDGVPDSSPQGVQLLARDVEQALRAELVTAEQLARYLWAARLIGGKRVLDAGCGGASGCAILAGTGAASVVGVDIAKAKIEAARPLAAADVALHVGDITALEFPDGSFDVAICFDVIDRLEDPEGAVAELARVLVAGGMLLVSSGAADLDAVLRRRFDHVAVAVQHPSVASVITSGPASGSGLAQVEPVAAYEGDDPAAERRTCLIAAASNAELPAIDRVAVLSATLPLDELQEQVGEQRRQIDRLESDLLAAKAVSAERAELARQLTLAEQQLAELPQLRDLQAQTARQLELTQQHAAELGRKLDAAVEAERERVRAVADLKGSLSWRITAPIRRLKQRVVRAMRDD
jgi:SAM-dependent methyltransferase